MISETHLEETWVRYEEAREEQDQLHAPHADFVRECESAQRAALDQGAFVIEMKSESTATNMSATELDESVREPDRYLVLLRSVAAEVQGL